MAEQPLTGGNLTPGVVRVGDTVRRPAGPHSAFVAALLTLLADRGFDGAPRYLGTDEGGRDVLSYLDGDVPARFRTWTDAQVHAAAALLRTFHDATRGSRLAGPHAVVCHHDPGPNNAVFRDSSARRLSVPARRVGFPPSRAGTVPAQRPVDGLPVAFIDFDFAAPGDPLEDVGYLAWTWCVSSKPTAPEPAAQARQLSVVADGYRLDDGQRGGLVDAMLERLERNARWWAGRPEEAASARTAWSWREHAFVRAHRDRFTAALADGAGRR
ncbi:phosphotransferase [Jiangella muralis]|uniref:phosphotransferase n=1 Tax=Jiangella muralis TaxID=702383 RepID=UPI00069CC7FB|nr:phosphotransferase [Jiangella muralis]